MSEVMMLAQTFKLEDKYFPAYVSEKYDGVACRINLATLGSGPEPLTTSYAMSRQNKPIDGLLHITNELEKLRLDGVSLIGELIVPGESFKVASGIIRSSSHERKEEIMFMVYDVILHKQMEATFIERMNYITQNLYRTIHTSTIWHSFCQGVNNYEDVCAKILKESNSPDNFEGYIVRPIDSIYELKRSYGMLKDKPKPTVDLLVTSFEEAISKDGEPLGMVGRINCSYKGHIIGVGPGKMVHADRKHMWDVYTKYGLSEGLIIEVQYMPDDSYDALRQPTFQRFRPDKTEPSYVA
jgi:ATP-dependent DNA ligase